MERQVSIPQEFISEHIRTKTASILQQVALQLNSVAPLWECMLGRLWTPTTTKDIINVHA